MYEKDTGDWMWQDPVNPEQPRNAGYYYKVSIDLDLANQELLSINDYKDFLEKCACPQKFKK